MNRPTLRRFEKPKHINDYPVGPCFEAGYLVTENSGWRTLKPIVIKEQCIGCFYCYLCCPEGVILRGEKVIDIDYAFCKGCGICAKVCPKKSIKMEREGDKHGK